MIICSALYYPGSLSDPQSLVRDNRFYPGKAIDTLRVWWQYLRLNYPDVKVTLFVDKDSPVSLAGQSFRGDKDLVTMIWTSAHSGQYFRPMQRNLVEAIILAYEANEDLFWLDNDAFLNTDIRSLVKDADCGASQIAHHQMTMDSVCTYISSARLHAMDKLGINLPSFLRTLLNEGPTETRMHLLQEGGLYKLFAYGRALAFGKDIQLSHLSCYDHFLAFLKRNPLDTVEYRELVTKLESFDWSTIPGVERSFLDMLYPENATKKDAQ